MEGHFYLYDSFEFHPKLHLWCLAIMVLPKHSILHKLFYKLKL